MLADKFWRILLNSDAPERKELCHYLAKNDVLSLERKPGKYGIINVFFFRSDFVCMFNE